MPRVIRFYRRYWYGAESGENPNWTKSQIPWYHFRCKNKNSRSSENNLLADPRNINIVSTINEAKESANIEAEKIIVSAKEQINNDKMQAITELKNNVAKISIEMTEKILKKELINKESHKEFISTSLKQSDLN